MRTSVIKTLYLEYLKMNIIHELEFKTQIGVILKILSKNLSQIEMFYQIFNALIYQMPSRLACLKIFLFQFSITKKIIS